MCSLGSAGLQHDLPDPQAWHRRRVSKGCTATVHATGVVNRVGQEVLEHQRCGTEPLHLSGAELC